VLVHELKNLVCLIFIIESVVTLEDEGERWVQTIAILLIIVLEMLCSLLLNILVLII